MAMLTELHLTDALATQNTSSTQQIKPPSYGPKKHVP